MSCELLAEEKASGRANIPEGFWQAYGGPTGVKFCGRDVDGFSKEELLVVINFMQESKRELVHEKEVDFLMRGVLAAERAGII